MSQLLQVTLLGSPTMIVAGQPLTPLITKKALALFVYLIAGNQVYTRDHLADLLWSEFNNQQARNNLRYLLPELRRPLAAYLTITPQTIGFNRQSSYWLDVEALQAALTAQLTAVRQTNASAIKLSALQTTLNLYQGKFLAGFTVRNAPIFEAWVRQRENELHQLALQGFYTLAEACRQQGEIQAGLMANQQLLQWEPGYEAGHRLQMRLLVAAGQRSAALVQYSVCRQLLADELGVEPEAATTALYEEIRRGTYDGKRGREENKETRRQETGLRVAMDDKPSHPVIRSLPHNLPGQLTPFVGRATEIDQLCTLLTDSTHPLITLTGLGGSGKTRLALAVAQHILDFESSLTDNPKSRPKGPRQNLKFPNGVWFVPLIGLTAEENLADQMAVAIMDALQLPRLGPVAPAEHLLDGLRDRHLLLILDSFEHLLAGVAFVQTLLQRAPGVKLFVTSRQILNLQAEVVWSLAGLALPEMATGATMTPTEAQGYDSIALFVERAQRADRGFHLDQRNQTAILQICHFVQGLPLAIELAAAMLRYHSCHELWQRLRQDYTALAVNQRDLPPRHRTITALFDHSWQLLTPEQADVLAACAIFPQSFTAEAAAAIADATHAILARLIDQSLLTRTASGRFELHELARQYAATQFAREPQVVARCRQRHADYYSALIEPDAEELMRSPAKLQIIQQELPNLRLTWWWGVEQRQLAPLMRLSEGLFLHFLAQGPLQEGWDLCYAVVERLRHWSMPPANEQEAHFFAVAPVATAYLGYYQGRYTEVTQLAHEAISRAEPLADMRVLAMGYSMLAMVAFAQGEWVEHERLCELALAYARSGTTSYMVVVNLAFLGLGLTVQGRLTAAHIALQEALQLVQAERLVYLEGYVLSEFGLIYAMSGDWALADGTTQQALQFNLGLNNNLYRGHQYARLALAAEALGDYDRAITWTDQALAFHALVPDPISDLSVLLVRGRALRHLGKLPAAETALQQLLTLAQGMARPLESAQAQLELGHVALAGEAWLAAEQHYHATLEIGAAPVTAAAQAGLAWLARRRHDLAAAQPWLEQACATLLTQPLASQYDAAHTALTCYKLLAVAHDPRTAALLAHAWGWLEAQALKISDDTLRHAFLQNVPAHRQWQEVAQSVSHIGTLPT